MSESPQSAAGSTSERGILFIEQYDALAAAIGSALKKFAPDRSLNVASSLVEAEAFARNANPALLIIDFDPAFFGVIEFLYRLRGVCPDLRVLIMGAGITNEVASEFRSLGALQFIKKPFELPDFGATVQALLGPWQNAGSSHLRGTLQSMSVADAVLVQCAGNRTVILEIKSKDAATGEIHIVDGRLVHAAAGKHTDGEALEEMFSWIDPGIEELETRSSGQRSLRETWPAVFLEAARRAAARLPKPTAQPSEPAAAKPPPKIRKKIVAIDDTEMLLLFVEDTLTLADPELEITSAPNGITGIKQVETILPDLVLLDYSLPDINGDEVCRRLLKGERTARIPILMMSGHVPEMTAAAESFENIVATIAKPFMSDAFVTLVQQTLSAGPRAARKISKRAKAPKPPPEKKILAAPPAEQPKRIEVPLVAAAPPPPLPAPPTIQAPARSTIATPVVAPESSEVVLGLYLEVLSMQLTPLLRVGTIRAKLSSPTVSLHASPAAVQAALPVETGFQLGRVELDAQGKIDKVRLIPTQEPFQRMETRNALQIGALDLVPHNSRDHVELTPTQNAPMMMHLLAHLELNGVELGPNFQVAQIVLQSRASAVRVTLSSEAVGQEQTGVFCETAAVRLDSSGRLAELSLSPLK